MQTFSYFLFFTRLLRFEQEINSPQSQLLPTEIQQVKIFHDLKELEMVSTWADGSMRVLRRGAISAQNTFRNACNAEQPFLIVSRIQVTFLRNEQAINVYNEKD